MANTTGFRATQTFHYKEEADYCDHCSMEDLSKAVGYYYEEDSCGPVFIHIVCAECRTKIDETAGEQDTTCHDCLQTVKVKDTIEWRGYDFDPRDGDEPCIVCSCCKEQPRHLKRVENFNAQLEEDRRELYGDDDDDDGHGIDDSPDDDVLAEEEDDIPDDQWDDLRS